jgi:hypothetical protein
MSASYGGVRQNYELQRANIHAIGHTNTLGEYI